MRYILNESTDPYFNLAAEEYLLKHTDLEVFSLWRNDNAIIVGKNQNTLSEINTNFVKERGIRVVRRQTGGGAVFHDLGNLNYTFIVNGGDSFNDFKGFAKPIMEALEQMGVHSEFSGRNDMLIDGMKFYWQLPNARHKDRVMHHGTLLFSSVKTDISGALKPRDIKFSDKAVKSVASRITNISDHIPEKMTVLEFRDRIFRHIMEDSGMVVESYTEDEISEIMKLRDEKYSTWDWNYGMSPKYSQTREMKFAGGTVEATLDAKDGYISEIRLYGDFFGVKDISLLEDALKGTRHREEDIAGVLDNVGLEEFIVNVSKEDVINLLI